MQVFVRQSLAIVSTGLLLSLQSYGAIAQNRSLTVSSDSVNQSYRTQQFKTLPEKDLKSRMPKDSVKAPANAAFSTGIITGTPGAVRPSASDTSNSNTNEQLDLPIDSPLSFGTSKVPYSTSRVLGGTTNPAQTDTYRRAGKLYMAFGGTTYNSVCSASMIGKSLLITAAHCVHDYGKGSNGWAKKVKFVPAKNNSSEPYLSFESTQYLIPTAYFNGTDTCTQTGVVCNNDIALVALNNNSSGQQAGNLTGYFGYAWNGYSYTVPAAAYQGVFGNKLFASITQLGYPASFDSGLRMQINTAYGAYYATGNLKNTWLGSAMTGGSSGGPWLVNFGADAVGGNYGSSNVRNTVVGVTSYGNDEQRMGSSWFGQNQQFPNAAYGTRGAGNIGKLVYDACDNPALSAWKLQSKGRCR
ncbi:MULTISPECIES: trypsin-like serine peptidase [Nostoc]|uniref:Trypsin-like serine protease n=2 Tax=Nostoc TaxID=1177 RepID=A0ABR8HZG0_9NOSO|nr:MULTISPECIES: trypsin-like serine protease [Nostoc]MBD2560844.1 trypsin-like serine protease [Nostoc linckia FACHB-391]MBD2644746.1 trypsin-like serine protease [Nostoc foliaceum FACHB-393]